MINLFDSLYLYGQIKKVRVRDRKYEITVGKKGAMPKREP
jgi:hypothetical protein